MSKSSSLRAVQRGVNNKPTIKGKRERDHHPATLTLTIEGDRERHHHPATLILKIEETTLGSGVSERVVAFTVWGLGGGCIKLRGS